MGDLKVYIICKKEKVMASQLCRDTYTTPLVLTCDYKIKIT